MAKQQFNFQSFSNKPKEEKEAWEAAPVASLVKQMEQKKEKSLFEVKYIPRNLISANKKNKYPQDKIEVMKESILNFGLQQNLTVIYLKSENEYIVEAGHTRMRALDELIEEFKNWDEKEDERYLLYLKNVAEYEKRGYPCRVAASIDDADYYYSEDMDLNNVPDEIIDSEIRLIITNEVKRDESPSVKAQNIARLDELYKRKNLGKKKGEKINVNEQIAADLNITSRQVINYKKVGKLIPGLQEAFDDNKISLKDSSSYATLSEEEQEIILALIESGKKVSKEEVKVLAEDKRKLEEELNAKEKTLNTLQNEIEKIRNVNKSLEEELSEQRTAEPIVLPDPKVPYMELQLKSKEKELENLKGEIAALKKKSADTKKLSRAQSEVVKSDLAFRNAFEECKKSISKFLEMTENLKNAAAGVDNEELKNLAILNDSDINERKNQLLEMINE